ncbi:MAG: RNA polymerase sigma factor [Acidobacteria bacterium]|nr:RNA polymerase sigma factor [Acidobacteriota bacterium]
MANPAELAPELERLHDEAYAWALACCRWDRDEGTEVLQTTYVKILDGRARFGGRSSLKTWLFSVIHRTAAERRRRAAVRSFLLRASANGHSAPPSPETPESLLAASERSSSLTRALRRLSRRQLEVLHLVFYQEMSVEEASKVLDITLGSARTHYERGKKSLRRLLREKSR